MNKKNKIALALGGAALLGITALVFVPKFGEEVAGETPTSQFPTDESGITAENKEFFRVIRNLEQEHSGSVAQALWDYETNKGTIVAELGSEQIVKDLFAESAISPRVVSAHKDAIPNYKEGTLMRYLVQGVASFGIGQPVSTIYYSETNTAVVTVVSDDFARDGKLIQEAIAASDLSIFEQVNVEINFATENPFQQYASN